MSAEKLSDITYRGPSGIQGQLKPIISLALRGDMQVSAPYISVDGH
jgi:hypothetical protein